MATKYYKTVITLALKGLHKFLSTVVKFFTEELITLCEKQPASIDIRNSKPNVEIKIVFDLSSLSCLIDLNFYFHYSVK